eukprot:scaffold3.g6643.t1
MAEQSGSAAGTAVLMQQSAAMRLASGALQPPTSLPIASLTLPGVPAGLSMAQLQALMLQRAQQAQQPGAPHFRLVDGSMFALHMLPGTSAAQPLPSFVIGGTSAVAAVAQPRPPHLAMGPSLPTLLSAGAPGGYTPTIVLAQAPAPAPTAGLASAPAPAAPGPRQPPVADSPAAAARRRHLEEAAARQRREQGAALARQAQRGQESETESEAESMDVERSEWEALSEPSSSYSDEEDEPSPGRRRRAAPRRSAPRARSVAPKAPAPAARNPAAAPQAPEAAPAAAAGAAGSPAPAPTPAGAPAPAPAGAGSNKAGPTGPIRKRRRRTSSGPPPDRSSRFRGVTKHRRSGRWEAHIWVKELGKQVYLGGYECEEHAAEAYDIAALKSKGSRVRTNFELSKYEDLLGCIDRMSIEELVMAVRRQSQGFSRGTSSFRGVTRHPSTRWEARVGVPGSKHAYCGLHEVEADAAKAYDRALVRLKGRSAATNFALSGYSVELADYHRMQAMLLRGDKTYQKIRDTPAMFERWLKSGSEAFGDLPDAPEAPVAAVAPKQEQDRRKHLLTRVLAAARAFSFCHCCTASGEDDDFAYMWDSELPGGRGTDSDGDAADLDTAGGELGSDAPLAGGADKGEDGAEPAGPEQGQQPQEKKRRKMKRGGQKEREQEQEREDEEEREEGQQVQQQQEGGKKKAKRRKRGSKLSAVEWEASRRLLSRLAELPPEEQADFLFASLQAATGASALEHGGLAARAVAALPARGRPLEARLQALAGGGWRATFCDVGGAPPGAPTVLYVAKAAMEAICFIKQVPAANKACKVAKLFAKHIKLGEHEEMLRKTAVACAAGTPNRLLRLADRGALQLDRLSYVLLDLTLDVKQRSILDLPETKGDWWALYSKHLAPRLEAGQARLVLVGGSADGHAGGGE